MIQCIQINVNILVLYLMLYFLAANQKSDNFDKRKLMRSSTQRWSSTQF